MSELAERLASEFADKDYAHAYMESHAISRLAAQVHALRKQRGWSQQQLADLAGVAQERITKIESGDFTSLTTSSLNKLARAFDVDLRVTFVPFSEGILDVVNLRKEALEVSTREADLATFNSRTLRIDRDGDWTLVDRLATVIPMATTMQPATPTTNWIRITPPAHAIP